MLEVKRIDLIKNYGFNYYTKFRNGKLIDERYVFESDDHRLTYAYVDASTYPELVIKNYAFNQHFVEHVFPRLIKDGIVELVEKE